MTHNSRQTHEQPRAHAKSLLDLLRCPANRLFPLDIDARNDMQPIREVSLAAAAADMLQHALADVAL